MAMPPDFRVDATYMSNGDLSRKYTVGLDTIRTWKRKTGITLEKAQGEVYRKKLEAEGIRFPSIDVPNLAAMVPHIQAPAIVASDWHIPYTKWHLATLLVETAKRFGIKRYVDVGDWINADILSSFDKRDLPVSLDDELKAAGLAIEAMLQWFDELHFVNSNHVIRLARALAFDVGMDTIWRMITTSPKVHIYPGESAYIGKTWLVTHPRSFSGVSTTVGRKLATIHHKNVLVAHGHHAGWAFDPSGDYVCGDLGGLVDPDKVPYMNRGGMTTHSVWNSGFWVIAENERAHDMIEGKTDWEFYLKEGK